MGKRGFAVIRAYSDAGLELPRRGTAGSAGYDLASAETVELKPGQVALIPTGLKAYMQQDEVLMLYIRSSLAVKHHLVLMNQVGIIDSDYFDNPRNEGHIQIAVRNLGTEPFVVEKGMRIAQGIFMHYLTVDDDSPGEGKLRNGGFGSTGM